MQQHDDAIGRANRGQPVRDRDDGRGARNVREGRTHRLLGLAVDARRRLVEQQHARATGERARNGHELLLPRGQARAAFAELRCVALLEAAR